MSSAVSASASSCSHGRCDWLFTVSPNVSRRVVSSAFIVQRYNFNLKIHSLHEKTNAILRVSKWETVDILAIEVHTQAKLQTQTPGLVLEIVLQAAAIVGIIAQPRLYIQS